MIDGPESFVLRDGANREVAEALDRTPQTVRHEPFTQVDRLCEAAGQLQVAQVHLPRFECRPRKGSDEEDAMIAALFRTTQK